MSQDIGRLWVHKLHKGGNANSAESAEEKTGEADLFEDPKDIKKAEVADSQARRNLYAGDQDAQHRRSNAQQRSTSGLRGTWKRAG